MDFTPEQRAAIDNRDRTLLVSAAAGSGKTATLTERIIRSILDEKHPIDISDMLIVTFTRAAARELSEKIAKAVGKALSEDRENERLKKQLDLLPAARICTIDSFFGDIVKANAEVLGINPGYRLAEAAEANILSLGILNAMIDEAFSGEMHDVCTAKEFEELTSCLADVKSDEELAGVFLALYERAKSAPDGAAAFAKLAELYGETEDNVYVSYSLSLVRELAEHFSALLSKASELLSGANKSEDACAVGIERDIETITCGTQVGTYDEAREFLDTSLPRKPAVKSDERTEAISVYESVRHSYDKCRKDLQSKLFFLDEKEYFDYAKKSREIILRLSRFIEKFDKVYFEQKRRAGILEFSDIERLAYELIIGEDGSPTDIALSLRSEFDAVYVDEYQDVNYIQHAIFEAISREDDRFMVGDVKQSIYVFRSARPEIFVGVKESFPDFVPGDKNKQSRLFMSYNFRSDKVIIDFVNSVFDKMFGVFRDSIGYEDGDRLKFGKRETALEERKPEVHVFVKSEEDEEESDDASDADARYVAEKISELVKYGKLNTGAHINYSDITLLFRNNSSGARYKAVFDKVGIPCEVSDNKDFFLHPDVLLMLCLLNSIDNPRKDIYLAGLMLSPLFSFTADELYRIKEDGLNLYSSLVKYVERTSDAKCAHFLGELKHYRLLSEGVGVDALISRLYSETGVLYLAAANGGRSNLRLLYDFAARFEKNGYKGLYSFINYVNSIIDNNERFTVVGENSDEDAVKISSIHSSKGLEYPVVFLVDAEKVSGQSEKRAKIAYSEGFGIGFMLRDESGLALLESPFKNAINLRREQKLFEEELRVLYVALTRAREQLYVIGNQSATSDDFKEKMLISRLHTSTYSRMFLRSFLDMICASADECAVFTHVRGGERSIETEEEKELIPAPVSNIDVISAEEIKSRFDYIYPYPYHTLLPEKLSISHLYPTVLDEDEDDEPSIDKKKPPRKKKVLPAFYLGKGADESAAAGIATHTFLQFFDCLSVERIGVPAELERLVKDGYISKKDADRVRITELEKFVSSKLFREMKNAKKLYRELRFNIKLPAYLFTEEEEKKKALADSEILLQGVIDCIIEDDAGELHLVDYKTDRLSKEELSDRVLAEKKLRAAHSLQLGYYKLAVEKMFGKLPTDTRIYSLHLSDTVEI